MTKEEALAHYGKRSKIEPKDRIRNLVAAVVVAFIALAVGAAVDTLQWVKIRDVQDQTIENRAVACSNLVQDGQTLPPPCLDPEVLQHYDRTP